MAQYRRMRLRRFVLASIACFAVTLASAQFRRAPEPEGGPPEAEFHMARLAYYSPGCAGSRGYCNPMWAIDYPHAEAHFLPAVERMTRVQVAPDSRHLTADDDDLFDYPWLFLQQPGRGWVPQGEEVERLREYLERGGFLVVDDFHGEYEWATFREAIAAVLPGRAIVDIPDGDALHGIMFDLDKRTQIPGERHLGWQQMEGPPHWRGIYDDHGRLMVAINHNIDMGDAWEHADDAHYPAPMTATAYRFGVNYVIYAMTH
ncbi:MAG TPA: DUF4159 domain-containing protein [Gammaproteobacteria bacterium]|nr:DUF4159 domain-containing protein [Gammaproteobacteria bacterium]